MKEKHGWLPAEISARLRSVIKHQLWERYRQQLQSEPRLGMGEEKAPAGAGGHISGATDFCSELTGVFEDDD